MNLSLWNRYHCFALLASSVAFLFFHSLLLFVLVGSASMICLFFISRNELKNLKPYGGWANRVTGFRFFATMLLALIYTHLSNAQIGIWLALVIPFDGLDGFLARKRNEQTNMGTYFDMETDVLFVCIAACILFIRGLAGYEIFIIAFIRYFYVFIVFILNLHRIKEQRTKIGPVVAVYVFIVISLAYWVQEDIRILLIYSALVLLMISFSYSFALLLLSKNRIGENSVHI